MYTEYVCTSTYNKLPQPVICIFIFIFFKKKTPVNFDFRFFINIIILIYHFRLFTIFKLFIFLIIIF